MVQGDEVVQCPQVITPRYYIVFEPWKIIPSPDVKNRESSEIADA